jgi:tRNA pseudouridine13 synthase
LTQENKHSFPLCDWHYLYGKPQSRGAFKTAAEDFQVEEVLGYELTGSGEHIYVWLEKQNLNTAYVGEQLAKQFNLPLRQVSYAGRKDKYALTRQWFGLHIPGKTDPDFNQFSLEGAKILRHIRHNKKLKTGNLKSNKFTILIRHLKPANDLMQRLEQVKEGGVPNYFGPQRFGNNNSNLHLGQTLLDGQTVRNRNKRNLAISALRSWLFNNTVSERVAQKHFSQPFDGDAMILSGSNSFFVSDNLDKELGERLNKRDIQLSAPLWGKGELDSRNDAQQFELDVAHSQSTLCHTLEEIGLEQQRRAISLYANNMNWQLDEGQLALQFELPTGCFATSILRELIDYHEPERTLQ